MWILYTICMNSIQNRGRIYIVSTWRLSTQAIQKLHRICIESTQIRNRIGVEPGQIRCRLCIDSAQNFYRNYIESIQNLHRCDIGLLYMESLQNIQRIQTESRQNSSYNLHRIYAEPTQILRRPDTESHMEITLNPTRHPQSIPLAPHMHIYIRIIHRSYIESVKILYTIDIDSMQTIIQKQNRIRTESIQNLYRSMFTLRTECVWHVHRSDLEPQWVLYRVCIECFYIRYSLYRFCIQNLIASESSLYIDSFQGLYRIHIGSIQNLYRIHVVSVQNLHRLDTDFCKEYMECRICIDSVQNLIYSHD